MRKVPAIVGGGSLLAGASFAWDAARSHEMDTLGAWKEPTSVDQTKIERMYTAEQVAERDGLDNRPAWLTVGHGVYNAHPGGKMILAAAGGPAEPFLAQWAAHWRSEDQAAAPATTNSNAFRLKPEVLRMLERMRVGTLVLNAG